jgi:sulfate adenylyltransferase
MDHYDSNRLIPPYGGSLVNLVVSEARAAQIKVDAIDYPNLTLNHKALCDLEQLATGGFSPLTGFMGAADYKSVLKNMRLIDGTLWPVPILLQVDPAGGAEYGKPLALRDIYGNLLAILHVSEIFPADPTLESAASAEGGTENAILSDSATFYASGRLEIIRTPPHFDFRPLRHTPTDLRNIFQARQWERIMVFHPTGPICRAEEAMIERAVEEIGGKLLIQPLVGIAAPGDVDHYTRIRCHRALVETAFDPSAVILSLLPLIEENSALRRTLLLAIIIRNCGCSHLLVSSGGLANELFDEIGIKIVESQPVVYLPAAEKFVLVTEVPAGVETLQLSDAEVENNYFARGMELPQWYILPELAGILAETHPARHRQGLTIWFTGLSGSGKSTVAHALVERLAEFGRNAAFLDGDEIRTHLSKGLGFSREDRDTNINRVGYVAGLVASQGGTTICSVISPFRGPRENARRASKGRFVEIYCNTPIEICESRDVKGLYARARSAMAQGNGLGFTGVDDPYEVPINPEVIIDTSVMSIVACVDTIIEKLHELGYIHD